MKSIKSLLMPAAIVLLGVAASAAHATEQSGSTVVTGSVVNSCTISSPATMDFGAMAKDASQTITGQISVTCGTGAAYTIRPHSTSSVTVTGKKDGIDFSTPVTVTGTNSLAMGGIGTLTLYKDGSATQAWHDAALISGTGNSSAQNYTVAMKFVHNGTNYGNFSLTLQPTVSF